MAGAVFPIEPRCIADIGYVPGSPIHELAPTLV
jgi:hypothetical protein